MTQKEIEDVLAAHADALNQDEELSEQLLAEHAEQADELVPLFQLATVLKAALTPVSAPAFKTKLGHELVNYGPPVVVLGRSVSKRKAKAWLALAAAGSVISVAGVVALLLRRVRTMEDVAPQASTAA
ncbi:MAG TPA: hypothetical protein VLE70_12550 [Anaerolineae bacterium]|jgi:hypothetical protein|nr:hypothetical protein [Anaerolineae bacterium]